MYAINGKWTFAIDVETGRQIWRTAVEIDPERAAYRAITEVRRPLYNGKLFRVTIDNHVVALDMKTGKEVWKQKFADAKEGYYATGAPIIANGVLISGHGGRRSRRRAAFSTAGIRKPERNCGGATRFPRRASRARRPGRRTATPGRAAAARRGVRAPTIRNSISCTGGPAMRSPTIRGPAARWTASTHQACLRSGRRPARSSAIFQYTPNDVYDVDGTDEKVLADIQIGGQQRKVMIQANKNGFMYVLDRTNCKPIAANALRQGQLGEPHRHGDAAVRC